MTSFIKLNKEMRMTSFIKLYKMRSLFRLPPIVLVLSVLVLSVGLAACGVPPGGTAGNTITGTDNGPAPFGAGFTELTPSPDSRIIHVSSSQGNDANSGEDEANPVQSIARGITLLRDGFPDWLLLRKGDTWYESLGQWRKSGRSASEPMVVYSYGASTARPLLKTGSGNGMTTVGSGGSPPSMDYLVFKGIHFYAHTRDPDSPEFIDSTTNKGIEWLMGADSLLIEDCKFDYYSIGIVLQKVTSAPVTNVILNRNVVVDSYAISGTSHSQGMYIEQVNGVVIHGNILDHNGWNDTITGAQKTIFNHGMYIQSTSLNVDIFDNIIMRSSSHGSQLRSGGQLNGNLLIENSIGFTFGGGQPVLSPNECKNNVLLNGSDIDPSPTGVRGWGIALNSDFTPSNAGVVADNILANTLSASLTPVTIAFGVANVTYSNNIIHDWGPGNDTGSPGDYVDPERSIESYSLSVGGLGARSDFIAQLRAQSADNWNDDYSIANIKQYFTDGFALK